MKYSKNMEEIALLQPDYLGFIFYEKSPRHLENSIPILDTNIKKVGVFVNASFSAIEEKVMQYNLDLVQLHGDETPEFCAFIETKLVRVIKAFSMDNHFNFKDLDSYRNCCSYFLFDTKGKHYGGNGTTFTWSILENYHVDKPFFLSGGIGFENASDLNQFLKKEYAKNCIAIDLNSQFESQAGLKNPVTLKEFINTINQ